MTNKPYIERSVPVAFRVLAFLLLLAVLQGCNKKTDETLPPSSTDDFVVPQVRDMILYEVNLRALGPDPGFNAVMNRLDDISQLSVNVLWLMPIHPIGTVNSVNSPYSVRDYYEVNPEFGDLAGLKELVSHAHERGIAVILDWVANHTAWDNPWIEHKDWYTQDGSGNIIHPPGTNWMDVADLNYNNQEMRKAMIAAMQYWIDSAGIDGYRCDAADMVPFDFWEQAIGELKSSHEKNLIFLAEGARKDHFTAGFQMNYSWDFYETLKNVFHGTQPVNDLFSVHGAEYAGLPEGVEKLRFTTNHDKSAWDATPMVIFNGTDGALAASVTAIFLGGVPLIYGSQEVGEVNKVPFFSVSVIDWNQNGQMLDRYKTLLEYYNGSEVAKSAEFIPYETAGVVSFMKSSGGAQLLVMVNTTDEEVSFKVPLELTDSGWNDALDQDQVQLGDEFQMLPYEYILLER